MEKVKLVFSFMVLMIPGVNFFAGPLYGLYVLFVAIVRGDALKLLWLLPMAGAWVYGAMYHLSFLKYGNYLEGAFQFVILAVTSIVFLKFLGRSRNQIANNLKLANEKKQGVFSMDCAFGDADGDGLIVCFDRDSRRMAFIYVDGFSIEPFDFVTGWNLQMKEVSTNGRLSYENVRIHLSTRSFDKPVIRVRLPSKAAGEAWMQRLSLMMDAPSTTPALKAEA